MSRVTPIMRIDELFTQSEVTMEIEPFYHEDVRHISIKLAVKGFSPLELSGPHREVLTDLSTITNIVKSLGEKDAPSSGKITERPERDTAQVGIRPIPHRNTKGASTVKDQIQRNSEAQR